MNYKFNAPILALIACFSSNVFAGKTDEAIQSQTMQVKETTSKKIGATLNKKVELEADAIPKDALDTVLSVHPKFTVSEAEKEFKHDKVYLDLEGEVDGSEIEFDMLQTDSGWQIVEVQRDLSWEQLPPNVADALKNEAPNFEAKRIIESKQYGTDITIYEFYAVDAKGKESRKEVKLENQEATLLKQEWKH